MKKLILPVFAFLALMLCLCSCATGVTGVNLYSPVNYTQEDAVKDKDNTYAFGKGIRKSPVACMPFA